ncbi:Uncharacterised protein [uncultured archaeon]|nr:Uncharacterised protein [uncultured archaeon]
MGFADKLDKDVEGSLLTPSTTLLHNSIAHTQDAFLKIYSNIKSTALFYGPWTFRTELK